MSTALPPSTLRTVTTLQLNAAGCGCPAGAAARPDRSALQPPLTPQSLQAWLSALRVAGYRFDRAQLADRLLRHGSASVLDAFGQVVIVQAEGRPQ